jgi:hypothetical protein
MTFAVLQRGSTKLGGGGGDIVTRSYCTENVQNCKNHLGNLAWNNVLSTNDVDPSFENFLSDFKALFELNFPPIHRKFNKNFHKKNNFMTEGLPVSRRHKILLHKKSLVDPSEPNISAYKTFRNIYNRVVRASKKLYFDNNLKKAKKNLKKPGLC